MNWIRLENPKSITPRAIPIEIEITRTITVSRVASSWLGHTTFRSSEMTSPTKPPRNRVCLPKMGRPVAVRQENLLATAFHPELTADARIHRYFVAMAGGPAYNENAPLIETPRVRGRLVHDA